MHVIGLDIGTTSLSAVGVECESGKITASLTLPNDAALPSVYGWEKTQDPEWICQTALSMIQQIAQRCGDVGAIGLDGQMHGILYVDANGQAISPLYTWQDERGNLPFGDHSFAAHLSERTGYTMSSGFGLTTHAWNLQNGKVPPQAAKVCTIFDYVGMKLTHLSAPLMHTSGAASLGLFAQEDCHWNEQALEAAGIDAAILPEVTDQTRLLGYDANGIPVSCAIGDNQAGFIGAVREMKHSLFVSMGTSGQVSMLSAGQGKSANVDRRPLGEGQSILVGSALCGGSSYMFLERFIRSCAELAGVQCGPLYETMNTSALQALRTDAFLRVKPCFNGTRAHPEERARIEGISPERFDATHLIGGMLMGMAQEMYELYQETLSCGIQPASCLIGAGNAMRKNPALRLAFERVFGLPVQIPLHHEEAAFGAALFGMTAAGLSPTLAQAQRLIQYQQTSLN